jgi:hypothetical protein
MKKTSKPAPKKSAVKEPAAKKSTSKPKRKAAGQGELALLVESLAVIADKLTETANRLSEAAGHADLTEALENLDAIADKLADTADRLAGTGVSEREAESKDEAGEGRVAMIIAEGEGK